MKRLGDGRQLLHQLLDRHERNSASIRRIIARPTSSFATAEARQAMTDVLVAASAAGAVSLSFDRDAPHLVDNVVLVDADRLYAHLGRTPATIGLAAALASLNDIEIATEVAAELRDYFSARWQAGKRALGIGPVKAVEAIALVRAAEAAFASLPGQRVMLRTRSTRLLGDSKALERALPKLIAFLRIVGRVPSEFDREEAARALGLEKFAQPVLVAGPLVVKGISVEHWPYIGLPTEAIETFDLQGPVRSILTIENLESFNRHVRECRQARDVVVYTGGFPTLAVTSILMRVLSLSGAGEIRHWGDIDSGGVRIACFLERSMPVPVRPHLMTAELAMLYGRPLTRGRSIGSIVPGSAFAALAEYLTTAAANMLEQEWLDPCPVVV